MLAMGSREIDQLIVRHLADIEAANRRAYELDDEIVNLLRQKVGQPNLIGNTVSNPKDSGLIHLSGAFPQKRKMMKGARAPRTMTSFSSDRWPARRDGDFGS
jgi:hypothetical protein